jgi:tetratricopeptide (TPR) repeat protein
MQMFVGREHEVTTLDECLDQALAGRGPLVLLSGEAGIGKTRLAEELTRRAQARDFLVTWGRAWEGEGTPAYFPWLQVVRRLRPSFQALLDGTRSACPEISALVDARRPTAEASAGPEATDPNEARFRMFDAFAELLRLASLEKPLVVILDDIHTADVSTLDLLFFVARSVRNSARLLLVGTMREATNAPRSLLAKIAREATTVPLARLPRDAVASWITQAAPDLAPSVDRLVSVSEGNPLFVGELIASARAQPGHRWSSPHELPLGIREAIRVHVGMLSTRTQDVLTRASVLGREFGAGSLEGDQAVEIAEAIAAGVLVPAGDGQEAGRYRFTHVLIRDELYAAIPPERRAELHRQAAADERDPTLATPHWLLGGRAEDAPTMLATVTDAIHDASARFAFEDAAMIGERALETLTFDSKEACELRIAVGEAWTLAGKVESARAAGARAAADARTLGDPGLLARAALVHATVAGVGGRDEAAVELLRAAFDALDPTDSPMRAKIMARLALALLPAPPEEHAGALQLAEDAIAMARRLDDEDALFAVLTFTRQTPSETQDARTRFDLNAETIRLAKHLGRVPHVASLFAWQVAACIELGDIEAAVREVDAMEALLSSYGLPAYRYPPLLVRAMLADIEGRFAEADALSREAITICEENGLVVPGLRLCVVQRTGFLYTRLDVESWAEVEPLAMRVLDRNVLFEIFRSTFDAPCGRVGRVRDSLALTKGVPLETLPDGSGLAAPCAIAGIVEHAERFYGLVERDEAARGPWQFGPGRTTSMGPRALTLGRLGMLLGRTEEAIRHFERALAYVERLRSRPFIAQAHLELATATGSREHAEAALVIASDIGMRTLTSRARALVDRSSGGTSREAPRELALRREGETWRIELGDRRVVLKDAKGLSYLEALVAAPCREIHVRELVGQHQEGDAGPILDERAKREYREKVASLRQELDEATQSGDIGRAERVRSTLDDVVGELSRAVGIGDRDRRAVSPNERARINVQRRIRDVIVRVGGLDPEISEYLQRSVRTGMFCVYLPVHAR